MDFKQLESYIAVVKYKSFTVAAERLGISQPTISIHIRKLEEELASRLLVRTAKDFEVTPRGREFYECAQNMVRLRDGVVDRWNGHEKKIIRLGVSSIPSAYILPELLPEYGKTHGSVHFAVDQSDSQGIIDAVRKGTYDIGLVGMKNTDEALEFQKFYEDRMVLVAPYTEKYKKLAEEKKTPIKELLQEPLILREEGSGSGKSAERFVEKMGISMDELQVAAKINDQEAIKNLVAGGLGLAIISEKGAENYVDARRLIKFRLPEADARRSFYIVYQKNYILKGCVQEFIDFLVQKYKQKKEETYDDSVTGKF